MPEPNQQKLLQTQTWEPKEDSKRKKLEEEFKRTTFYYGTVRGKLEAPGAEAMQKFASIMSDRLTVNRLNKFKQFSNPILNRKITYKDQKGDDKEGVVRDLLTLPKDSPGRIAAEEILPAEGTPEREKIPKLSMFRYLTMGKKKRKEYKELKKHKKLYDLKSKEEDAESKLKNTLQQAGKFLPSMSPEERKASVLEKVRNERGFYWGGNRMVGYFKAKKLNSFSPLIKYMKNKPNEW